MSYSFFEPAPLLALLGLSIGGLVGCWTGASSQGLPCTENQQCGVGLECVNNFCGGEPSDELCGNGWLDPNEECDEGEQNADNGACRPDCTTELCGDGVVGPTEACDDGEQNADDAACKADCTVQVCGDGATGLDEQCDDGNSDAGDGCSPTCTLEACGNGVVDANEDCDDGVESAQCDDDCSFVECGDMNINEAAGEDCEQEGEPVDSSACLSNCTVPLLWDDLEPDTSPLAWETEVVNGPVSDTWVVSQRNAQGERSWDSGLPADTSGSIRLVTPPIDLGALSGQGVELRFQQARAFVDCNDPVTKHEGAIVEVSVDDGPFQKLTPADPYNGVVGEGDGCSGVNPNPSPFNEQEGYVLDTDYVTEVFDLSSFAGSSVRVGFHVAWNCQNCTINFPQENRGWFIDNFVVSRQP